MKTILRSAKSHSINVCKHTQPMTSGAEAQEILDFSSARPKPCPFKAIYQLLSRSSDRPISNRFWSFCLALLLVSTIGYAGENSVLRGVVTDPAGAVVPRATVELLRSEKLVNSTVTDDQGRYQFSVANSGRYRIRATAPSFALQESAPVYVSGGSSAEMNVTLNIGPVSQQTVVSATGTEMPESWLGASVSVI